MNNVNPFLVSPQMTAEESEKKNLIEQGSVEDRLNTVSLQALADELVSLESDESIDRQIILEKRRDLEFLLSEFQALQEIMRDFSHLVVDQGEVLDKVEEHTEKAAEETVKGDQELTEAVKEVKKGRRGKVGILIGGSAGGALGLIGFAVNPLVGVATLVIGGALGGGVGGIVGMTSK